MRCVPIKHALLSLSLFRAMREPSLQDRIGVRAFFCCLLPQRERSSGSRKTFRVGRNKKLRPARIRVKNMKKVVGLLINMIALVAAGGIYVKLDMPVLGIAVAAIGLFIGTKLMKNS